MIATDRPLLEAINVGSVDFGYVGDSPPIFAQAGCARIKYVAAVKSDGNTQAKASVSPSAKDRARTICWSRHWKKVAWSDITLAPADAPAAFVKGSVDPWSIWDPSLALAELKDNARVIAFDKDVHKPNAFYIARSGFVDKYPSLVAKLNVVFASEGKWADSHHEEVARAQAEATGVDIDAIRRFVDRSNYRVVSSRVMPKYSAVLLNR